MAFNFITAFIAWLFIWQRLSQLLNSSISEAETIYRDYCWDKLQLKEFRSCGPPEYFKPFTILLINNAFGILNSHKICDFVFKEATSSNNIENIKSFLSDFWMYNTNSYTFPLPEKIWISGFVNGTKTFNRYSWNSFLVISLLKRILNYFFGTIHSQADTIQIVTCKWLNLKDINILI